MMTLWGFLSVGAVCGVLMIMFTLYLNHKKEMKQMELEAVKTIMTIRNISS